MQKDKGQKLRDYSWPEQNSAGCDRALEQTRKKGGVLSFVPPRSERQRDWMLIGNILCSNCFEVVVKFTRSSSAASMDSTPRGSSTIVEKQDDGSTHSRTPSS